MPPPYTIGQVQGILNASAMGGGHPYNHAGGHANTNFQNAAELEEVVRYVLNNSQVYINMGAYPANFPRPYRYSATVCLAGLTNGAGNPYRCRTPHHGVPPGAPIQAATIVLQVDMNNMWGVWTFVPYTLTPAGMGGLVLGQLAHERFQQ
jgi:hypothetical protein